MSYYLRCLCPSSYKTESFPEKKKKKTKKKEDVKRKKETENKKNKKIKAEGKKSGRSQKIQNCAEIMVLLSDSLANIGNI